MKLWRGLMPRIGGVAIGCALVGTLAMTYTTSQAVLSASSDIFGYFGRAVMSSVEGQRCRDDPASWSLKSSQGVDVYAYDAITGLSANPEAPPLDETLRERWKAGATIASQVYVFERRGGSTMIRYARHGPCAVLQATWQKRMFERATLVTGLVGLSLPSMMVAALLGVVFVVRPLLRRIERLRVAAAHVGALEGYQSPVDGLADEVSEVAVSLDRAHERINEDGRRLRNRQKALEGHLVNIAHDLKTPLASLQLALESAVGKVRDEETNDVLTSALMDAVYLGELTDNLRIACQIRDGADFQSQIKRVDLGRIVDWVRIRHRLLARRRGISLDAARPDAPLIIESPPTLAQQALSNIVQNAVAYGRPDGHVAIVLEAHEDATFTLTVVDDGPGVPPTDLPRLGERTFRSDAARRRDPKGSGLGLAITAAVCQQNGWALQFDTEEPQGLRVTITGALRG